jgi:hypothetical protein
MQKYSNDKKASVCCWWQAALFLSPAAETHAAKRELCARGRFGFKMLNCATALILPG